MQFIDLASQFKRIEPEVISRVNTVLCSQKYIMGPEVLELEEKLASFVGVKHVLSCSSGTDALLIALMAYDLEKNDAVFVPSFTFFASAESVSLAGATPVFVDSQPDTFNISPASLESAIEKTLQQGELRPRGIMPVDLFGQPADYGQIQEIASRYGLFVLEDACQSFGAIYRGAKACSFGDVAATSFFPAKPLGCYGDGGAIFTDNDQLAEKMRSIRIHGQGIDKYDNVRLGINGRLDTIQAAILLAKLEIFEDELVARNEVAQSYSDALAASFTIPFVAPDRTSVWAQYTVLTSGDEQRSQIVEKLKARGIPTAIYYTTPIHLSTAYKSLGYKSGDLPVCELLSQQVLSIPMHPYLGKEDIDIIVAAMKECVL
ncbi:MAG: DegT/DnrJ/EryC1/StrS family aminotransferase [Eggerthellaceae bacterium]|nr:DegT/DnrJ/EryC1/StrS family aminotransferase [Eggerthellaceae bacterium]